MTEGCQEKKLWHRAGRPPNPKHKLLFFSPFPFLPHAPKPTFARMFPVEICNLCKIKWVTSCRCVYELETLRSKQLQRPDSNHKHHRATVFVRGGRGRVLAFHRLSWGPPFCNKQKFYGNFLESQWETAGFFLKCIICQGLEKQSNSFKKVTTVPEEFLKNNSSKLYSQKKKKP